MVWAVNCMQGFLVTPRRTRPWIRPSGKKYVQSHSVDDLGRKREGDGDGDGDGDGGPALPISRLRIPSLHLQASLPLLSCLIFCLDLLYFYYQCVFLWSLHDHAMRFWKWHNCSLELMVCNFSTHIVMQMYICWAVPLSSLQSCVLDMDCFSNTTIMT